MAAMTVCSSGFMDFINSSITQITLIAGVVATVMIVFSYYIGQMMSNPKVTVWAKTEIIQLVVSAASVAFIILTINTFCAIDMGGVASIFEISGVPSGTNVYTAAQNYMHKTLEFSHNATIVVRYHLQGFTVLNHLSAFECDLKTGSIGWGCLFAYSGQSGQPLGAYSSSMGSLNLFFNTALVAYMTTLNFLLVLLFIYKGFVLFLLPFGIFVRSMPYLRSMGSLLIAVAMSFMIVYPLILSIFGLMGGVLLKAPDGVSRFMDESVFPDNGGASGAVSSIAGASMGADYFECLYFADADCGTVLGLLMPGVGDAVGLEGGGDNIPGAIAFAAYAFVAGVFLPTAALLATIASIYYVARLYGEEINLSRLIQMV